MKQAAILSIWVCVAILPFTYGAEKPPDPRKEIITGIKDLEKDLGFKETHNFQERSAKIDAYYRCYYTGKLELPDSYDDLLLKQGGSLSCSIDPEKYDIFRYRIEAVASGSSPVTAALAEATTERVLMVVPHEDFHQHQEIAKLPSTITEAAATLIGFLTGTEFAQKKFGPESQEYLRLAREADLFLRKAKIVNAYHTRLGALYKAVRAGEVQKQDALASKEKLFRQVREECSAITPDPHSFNKWLAVDNNAGLAFDITYTKYYPLLYDMFVSQGRDLRATIQTINRVLNTRPLSEAGAVQMFQEIIKGRPGKG